ncbi:hypothetical protein J31TS4_32110 [Paenibacillus sp. J31TS4]|uniref:hypothetical protein n=1 Tax=Paenibacillus sp. J31TS4 TaxID=2807195 RepID=UPI001B04EE58|nr:hypothetical protein [Paenibacillus sp. J31TS4]GIP39931.1 hypothetical protein J31TS4_32110 [Paenibacillus sp. J31TS4]
MNQDGWTPEAGASETGGEGRKAGISRRKMLQTLSAGGVLLAGNALVPRLAFGAEETVGTEQADTGLSGKGSGGPTGMLQVPNVEALLNLPQGQWKQGTTVYVGGYYREGDGGAKIVRWVEGSTRPDNGGSVHDPTGGKGKPGRWEQLHGGVGDFRCFGIFGETKNADDALDAMVNDPAIYRIEAHTNLNFVRRHKYSRSGIELDFYGHTVTTNGIELNTRDNPFGAVLFFQGTPAGPTQTVTLSAELIELTDVLEVADASAFQVEDWWIAQVKNNPGGGAQRELDYLLKVTEILDSKHIRVNYKLGWALAAGRVITYKKMNPVFRCHVRNMRFVGVPVPPTNSTSERPFETWDQIGSNPVAYEFAVECDVSGVRATKVFWPVVQRRYCTHYVTERCELINPEERDWGGTGYLTQQLNVLYGHVRDCNTSNARHLNDFTCAGYCMVENCHGDGDDYGPFVTHGQFEHDLVYIGNSGLLSFANSGTTWGDSAKRITVRKHVATRIVAHKKLTDLTLEDVHAFYKEGLANSGTIWANADGLQMRGCTAETMLTLSRSSNRSKRANLADGCTFGMTKDYEISRPVRSTAVGNLPVDADFTMTNCQFLNVDNNNIGSFERLVLVNTWFKGASPAASPIRVGSKEIVMQGGGFQNTGFVLKGAYDQAATGKPEQAVTVDGGAVFHGTNAEKAFLKSVDPANNVTWSFGGVVSRPADAATAHFQIEGAANRLKAIGSRFVGGKYEAAKGGFGGSNYFFLTSCVEEGVNRSSLPAEGDGIKHSEGNLTIGG